MRVAIRPRTWPSALTVPAARNVGFLRVRGLHDCAELAAGNGGGVYEAIREVKDASPAKGPVRVSVRRAGARRPSPRARSDPRSRPRAARTGAGWRGSRRPRCCSTRRGATLGSWRRAPARAPRAGRSSGRAPTRWRGPSACRGRPPRPGRSGALRSATSMITTSRSRARAGRGTARSPARRRGRRARASRSARPVHPFTRFREWTIGRSWLAAVGLLGQRDHHASASASKSPRRPRPARRESAASGRLEAVGVALGGAVDRFDPAAFERAIIAAYASTAASSAASAAAAPPAKRTSPRRRRRQAGAAQARTASDRRRGPRLAPRWRAGAAWPRSRRHRPR